MKPVEIDSDALASFLDHEGFFTRVERHLEATGKLDDKAKAVLAECRQSIWFLNVNALAGD